MDKLPLKFDHTGEITPDLSATEKFYTEILGFTAGPVVESQDGEQKMQLFTRDEVKLEFIQPKRELTPSEIGLKHLAFTCPDIDAAFDLIVKQGGYKSWMKEPLIYENRKLFFFYGPGRALFEVMESPQES